MQKIFRIVPLPTEVAEKARHASAPDHQIVVADKPDAYPCRHCLRWAEPGEALVLFPYQSIPTGRPYSESGPIFVHQEPCERYSVVDEYPAAFRAGRVVRGYDARDEMIAAEVASEDPETIIVSLLANPAIAFLQVRSVTRGCLTFKIERASDAEGARKNWAQPVTWPYQRKAKKVGMLCAASSLLSKTMTTKERL